MQNLLMLLKHQLAEILFCRIIIKLTRPKMPKQLIIPMEYSFPFGCCQLPIDNSITILIRKIYPTSFFSKKKLLQKIKKLRQLQHQVFVKVQSALQDEEALHCLFEYVPTRFVSWVEYAPHASIRRIRDQLIEFADFLAENKIRVRFELKNVGLNQSEHAKYFQDLNYQIIQEEPCKLKGIYAKELIELFAPYLKVKFISTCGNSDKVNDTTSTDQKELIKSASGFPCTKNEPDSNLRNTCASLRKSKLLEKKHQIYHDVVVKPTPEQQNIMNELLEVLDSEDEHQSQQNTPYEVFQAKNVLKNNLDNDKKSQLHGQLSQLAVPKATTNINDSTVVIDAMIESFEAQAPEHVSDLKKTKSRKALQIKRDTARRDTADSEALRKSIDIFKRVMNAIQKSKQAVAKFHNIRRSQIK